MNDFFKFLKSTGIYLIGNVLVKVSAFMLLPLYTNYLNPVQYGIYDLNITYVTFLTSVLFLDIWSGVMRFMFDYNDKNNIMKPISTGFVIFIISSIIYSIIFFIMVFFLNIEFALLLFFYGLLSNMQNLFGYISRGFNKNILYSLSGVVGAFITIISNIIFLVYFRKGYESLYISSIIGFISSIVIILIGLKNQKLFSIRKFDISLFKQMYIFSLPLCLNSVAYWFLTGYNKIVISNVLGNYENGLYSIAGKFSAIIALFTQCFQMAWQEMTFSKGNIENKEMGLFYTKATNEYIKFLCLGFLIIIPIIRLIFPFMVEKSYYNALNVIPFYLIATVLSSLSSFLGSIFGSIKKTNFIFSTTLFGSITNVIIIHLTISTLGLQAASFALFMGFGVNVIRRIKILKRFLELKIDFHMMFFLVALIFIEVSIYIYAPININIIFEIFVLIILVYIYIDKIKEIKSLILKNKPNKGD